MMNLIADNATSSGAVDFNKIDQQAFPLKDNLYHLTPQSTNIAQLIQIAIQYIFPIAGMLLLVYLIFGGLQLMLSQGDPKAAGGAKAHITNALIGFIIIFIAYWVVQLFGTILGLSGIGSIFK